MSELCLGTMHFGWKTDERTSGAILDAFHAAGGNFVQAASATPVGSAVDLLAGVHAEKHVGKWMASRRVPRDAMVLATRLVVRNEPLSDGALAECVRRSCETSLRRMRAAAVAGFSARHQDPPAPKARVARARAILPRRNDGELS